MTNPPLDERVLEEKIGYLQGQIAGLGSMLSAVLKHTNLSPTNLQVIAAGLTNPDALLGTNEKNSPEYQAGFKDISKFVGGLLLDSTDRS